MSAEPNATASVNADPAVPPSTTDPKSEKQLSSNPASAEMPGSNSSEKRVSFPSLPLDISPKSILNTTDTTLTRLNALLKTPGGLTAFLGTFNYGLYILTHAHLTAPTRASVLNKLRTLIGLPATKLPAEALKPSAPTTPLLPLALTVAETRTTLRLVGLIPLYALLKSLIKTRNQAKDQVTHSIQLAQATFYIGFQLLENIHHLTNKTVLSANWTNARFARFGGNTKLMTWSCRSWCAGITCDFLRLARQVQLSRQAGSEYSRLDAKEKKEADKKFWTDLLVATSWYPMALHYAVEGGIGLNMGVVGACGFFAYVGNFLKLWEATKA